jgi:hypothetical protein
MKGGNLGMTPRLGTNGDNVNVKACVDHRGRSLGYPCLVPKKRGEKKELKIQCPDI